jgi:pre-60S factor REI1
LEERDLDSDEDEPELLPTQCLFCNLDLLTLEENIDHMYLRHGLFIPEPARIIDMETFLTYLAALVFRYTECLYCGLQKGSRQGVQAHMRDKGHCMINTDAESELFDFWVVPGSDDDDAGEPPRAAKAPIVKVSDTELLLPSGAILGPRADRLQGRQRPSHTEAGKRARVKALAIENGTADARPSNDRRVAVRGEQGLIGVSDQQRRALMVVEKKMMKREAVARSAQRWATERVANKQKFFRVGCHTPLWSPFTDFL